MADTISREERSDVMRRVRSKDTTPEMTVGAALHKQGFRYRLHQAKLPESLTWSSRNSGPPYSCMDVCGIARMQELTDATFQRGLLGGEDCPQCRAGQIPPRRA